MVQSMLLKNLFVQPEEHAPAPAISQGDAYRAAAKRYGSGLSPVDIQIGL
jgi:hypothetical protein